MPGEETPPPGLIATIGLHGSASTWVFNVVRELMIDALGESRDALASYLPAFFTAGVFCILATLSLLLLRGRTGAVGAGGLSRIRLIVPQSGRCPEPHEGSALDPPGGRGPLDPITFLAAKQPSNITDIQLWAAAQPRKYWGPGGLCPLAGPGRSPGGSRAAPSLLSHDQANPA